MLRTALPFALLASALAWSASDSQRPVRFEVASIKPHGADELVGARYLGSQRGRLSIRNSALRGIIQLAFGVDGYRLLGGPKWINELRYDVEARPAEPADDAAMRRMLQTLLVERCSLLVHHETRTVSGYELVLANSGRLRRSDKARAGSANSLEWEPGQIRGSATMTELARLLNSVLRAPVEDKTALPGRYKIELRWFTNAEGVAVNSGNPLPDEPEGRIFEALQRAGLRLKRAKLPVDVVVIDRVERPTPN
jgi:uncharacterized protein (TIGR03435 family)